MSVAGAFDHHRVDARVGAETVWAELRKTPGLPRSECHGGFRIVSRFEDVRDVLLAPELFSSAQGITLPVPTVRSLHIPVEVDPPLQHAYRQLMSRFLSRERVRAMQPAVEALVARLLDSSGNEARFDAVALLCRPLPVHVSLRLVGFPPEDGAMLDGLVVDLHAEVATGRATGAARKLTDYVGARLDERGRSADDPDADLVSAVILGTVEGRRLSRDEQVSMIRLLLIGGFDSTAFALAGAVHWLAVHPEDAARLRAEPALIDIAAEEFVRFTSPASYLARTVSADTCLAGTPLAKGEKLLINFGGANRDPMHFDRAEEAVIDRSPNRHLGFGAGVHRCIGVHVAKLELRVALTQFLRRYSAVALDPERPPRWSSGGNQGIAALPLIVTPSGAA